MEGLSSWKQQCMWVGSSLVLSSMAFGKSCSLSSVLRIVSFKFDEEQGSVLTPSASRVHEMQVVGVKPFAHVWPVRYSPLAARYCCERENVLPTICPVSFSLTLHFSPFSSTNKTSTPTWPGRPKPWAPLGDHPCFTGIACGWGFILPWCEQHTLRLSGLWAGEPVTALHSLSRCWEDV